MKKLNMYKVLEPIYTDLLEFGYRFINDFEEEGKDDSFGFDSHFITRQVIYMVAKKTIETEFRGSMYFKKYFMDYNKTVSYDILFNPLNSDNWYIFSTEEKDGHELLKL